jgi:hypothetical protein
MAKVIPNRAKLLGMALVKPKADSDTPRSALSTRAVEAMVAGLNARLFRSIPIDALLSGLLFVMVSLCSYVNGMIIPDFRFWPDAAPRGHSG